MSNTLCPRQQSSFDGIQRALDISGIALLTCDDGRGRSTVARKVHEARGGRFLGIREFVDAMEGAHPLALEETLHGLLMRALAETDLLVVDDLHLVNDAVCCNFNYPRSDYIKAPLTAVASYVLETGKKLMVAGSESLEPLQVRGYAFGIDDFRVEDYRFLCDVLLGERGLNFEKIHRFAPRLNAHQLKSACTWLSGDTALTTERFIEYLRSQRMTSNVDLTEVEQVDLRDLKGVDDVIESLEAQIVLPLENDALASRYGLRPRRGVLLVGPPGTGKTTVGRALSHRLKSKFFLIDGTFISGTQNFYGSVNRIFEAAKDNSPAVIFIDDSDVIFENNDETGLYRYLLTMLDGIESESQAQVCIMMTAMNVSSLPPALIRSGRIELWLEMGLPDADARREILQTRVKALPEPLDGVDLEAWPRLPKGSPAPISSGWSTTPRPCSPTIWHARLRPVRSSSTSWRPPRASARTRSATSPPKHGRATAIPTVPPGSTWPP